MPILRGRDLAAGDVPGTAPVVVVTEAVARTLFPDQDPIGQRVGLGWAEESFEIVGVVRNARVNSLRVGGRLLMLEEGGRLLLATPGPTGLTIDAEHQLFEARAWTPPTLVKDRLYIRNRTDIMAYRLPTR